MEVENTTLENSENNKPNLQAYEAARCYSEPKNSQTHPNAASQGGAVLLLPACLEESGTNSSARSLAGSGSEQRSSASSCTTTTSTSSSVSPASASDNNKNERARFSTDQRISSLQTVASAPIVQGQFSQEQDANTNVKNSQKQLPKDQVIPNNNSVNVPRNSKEAVTVATSSVMFVNSPPKSCKYLLFNNHLFIYGKLFF